MLSLSSLFLSRDRLAGSLNAYFVYFVFAQSTRKHPLTSFFVLKIVIYEHFIMPF